MKTHLFFSGIKVSVSVSWKYTCSVVCVTVWRSNVRCYASYFVDVFAWETLSGVCVCVRVCGLCVCLHARMSGRMLSVTDIESQLWGPSVWLWPSSSPSHLQRRGRRRSVCVCVHNTGCETVFVCCRINFGIHTVFMWTWLLLWRCWPLAEGIHIHSGTLAMHSLHNTHSFYSQREPRVCPLAPGQADLRPLKTPGHSCKTSAGKRRRQDNVNPRAAVNI